MRTKWMTGLAAVGLLTASLGAVGATQPQGPPKPPAEMSQMAYFEGMWTCSGKMMDSPMGPGGAMKSTVNARKDLDGFFVSGVIKGTMPNMPPFEGRFNMTYDTGLKQYVMLWIDSMGAWAQNMSTGWKGDTMVFEGEGHMAGQAMKGRDTFSKSGPTSMKHTMEMEMGGKWMAMGEETCTKK
jgi:hypothetical protein